MKNWKNIPDRAGFIKRLQELIDCEPSQNKFAKKIGIANGTISRWKNFDSGMEPDPKTIDTILRVTGCSYDWLIFGKENKHNTTNITGDDIIYAGRNISTHDKATIGHSKNHGGQQQTLTADEVYLLKLLNRFDDKESKIEELIGILINDLKKQE